MRRPIRNLSALLRFVGVRVRYFFYHYIFQRILARDFTILAVLIAVAAGSSIVSALWSQDGASRDWWSDWLQNFGTEMLGAVVTFALIELVVGTRREREGVLRNPRSTNREVVQQAIHEARERGWLSDGSLTGADLYDATLPNAQLSGAYLARAVVQSANLSRADLTYAHMPSVEGHRVDLSGARLLGANLEHAWLTEANLAGADLSMDGIFLASASLRDAYLPGADLRGANLDGTNPAGAVLDDAVFSEATTLPDGQKWTPDSDLTRFTDPDHPDFWQRDWSDEHVEQRAASTQPESVLPFTPEIPGSNDPLQVQIDALPRAGTTGNRRARRRVSP